MLPVSTRWTEVLKELVRIQVYQRDVCNKSRYLQVPHFFCRDRHNKLKQLKLYARQFCIKNTMKCFTTGCN